MERNKNSSQNSATISYVSVRLITVKYKVRYGSRFWIDGDMRENRVLEKTGSIEYVQEWIRNNLRKLENGQMKVKSFPEFERDWEQEEELKSAMWRDVNTNGIPVGFDFEEIICYKELKSVTSPRIEYNRPPSPSCKIS